MSYSKAQETLTPAVFIDIEKENLTEKIGARISSFEFEEIDDGDDKISLRIIDEYGEFIDSELFQVRNKIQVQWGYIGGVRNLSAERTGVLLEPEYSFSQAMTMITLNALDNGSKLHGRADQKVWTQIKHSDIAAEIARKHQLKTSIKETAKILQTEPQGNKSDYEFLTYLASQNNYDFYVDVDTLHFHPKNKNQRAVLTINRKSKDAFNKLFVSFTPQIKTQQEKSEATEVTAIGYDPIKRESVEHKANLSSKQEAALGSKSLMINLETGDTKHTTTETGHIQATPHTTQQQVEAEAETQRMRAEDNQITAELVIHGVPWLRAKKIVEILGVGKKYSGRYYIKSIRHTIDSGGYKCTCQLQRDAIEEEKTAQPQKEVQNQGSDGENPKQEETIKMKQINLETGEVINK